MNLCGLTDSLATLHAAPNECRDCHTSSRIAHGLCLSCLLRAGADEGENVEAGEFAAALDAVSVADTHWRLGNYEILEEIGRGGMGVIYRARQRHSRRIVALKRVLGYHADSRETLARFRREAEAAASLDHPNILPIYEVAENEEGVPYFSMKFAPGGSLQEVGPALRDDPREVVRLLAKVTRAVQNAHRQGILHRDLKPGNILLDGRGEPLVSDFGLAKWLDTSSDLTRTLTIFGTPGYIAPEQARGPAASLKPSSDIYSLGAILFDLLAGRPPFLGEHALAVIHQAAEDPAPKLRSLVRGANRDLETICAHCLEREPGARYQSAGDLAEDLERWLEGRPIVARSVLPPVRLWRWSRRNPVLAGAAVVCIGLGLALGLSRQWDSWRLESNIRDEQLAAHTLLLLPLLDLDTVSATSPQAVQATKLLAVACEKLTSIRTKSLPVSEAMAREFSWKDTDLRRSAITSGARAYLIGTVRQNQAHVRLILNLVEAASGRVLDREVATDSGGTGIDLSRIARTVSANWYRNENVKNLRGLRGDVSTATRSELAQNYLLAGDDLTHKRNQENFDRAVECYRKATIADPNCALAYASLASAISMRVQFKVNPNDLKEGLTLARRAVEIDPTLADAHRAEAVAYTLSGQFASAIEASIQAFELDPTYQRAPGLLGALADLMGRPDLALRWFDWASRLQSQPGEYACNIAMTLIALGEDKDAEVALHDSQEFRPEMPDPIFALVSLRMLQGRSEEAYRLARSVMQRFPSDSSALQALAEASLIDGKLAEAEEPYRKLLKLDRNGGLFSSGLSYLAAMGWICLQTGRETEGRALLSEARARETEALALASQHPRHLYSMAGICAGLGNQKAALTWLERAIGAGWIDGRFTRLDPRFSSLISDTHFQTILKALDLRVSQLRRQRPTVKVAPR